MGYQNNYRIMTNKPETHKLEFQFKIGFSIIKSLK